MIHYIVTTSSGIFSSTLMSHFMVVQKILDYLQKFLADDDSSFETQYGKHFIKETKVSISSRKRRWSKKPKNGQSRMTTDFYIHKEPTDIHTANRGSTHAAQPQLMMHMEWCSHQHISTTQISP